MIDVADLPPHIQERVICSIVAANKYQLPPNILLAVAERENGRPGQWVKNTNGTHDVGSLQFNTAYLRDLRKYGITPSAVSQPGCYSYYLAAWRLKRHIVYDKQGDIWTRVANYHSYTPKYNAKYRSAIINLASKWERWLTIQGKPTLKAKSESRLQPSYTQRTNYVPRTIRIINSSEYMATKKE